MILLSALDFSLPLTNPVIIFSLVLFIILFAPILFNKFKIPHIIGLILAGVIIGPYGLNLLLRDSSIVLFGTVGLLYIMFTAALEIDMEEFKKNRVKSLVFGLFTFSTPMIIGSLAAVYLLKFSWQSSVLLASMLASHTLLAYPIVSKYGIAKIRAVTLTIGGTIITDVLALIVLATVTGVARGEIGASFWMQLAAGCVVFSLVVFLVFPPIVRWFFKNFDDNVSQYIFVLAMVFLGSFLAEVAGLEAIIGAFFSGLALNRFIPHLSPLMNRIEFVGNAFFIPFFLIGVGMLVDVGVLFEGFGAIRVALVMITVAVVSKYIAAWLTQKTFKLSNDEGQLIFGLSNARVGATLAVVLVGYNIILAETAAGNPIRLLNEDVLNGTVLMILVTCTISSLTVEKAARKLAIKKETEDPATKDETGKILISLAYPDNVTELVDLALLLKPHKKNVPVYALHVTDDSEGSANRSAEGKKILEKASKHASATNNFIIPLSRYDFDISNGIIYTIKEYGITDVIIGLHKNTIDKAFLGPKTESILSNVNETVFIYKALQPFNTLKRMVVAVPPNAEKETGFLHWLNKLSYIAKEAGLPILLFSTETTSTFIKEVYAETENPPKTNFYNFNKWDDFLMFTGVVKKDDLFVVVSSRPGMFSYHLQTNKVSYYLSDYFENNSFLILYPKQEVLGMEPPAIDPSAYPQQISKKLGYLGKKGIELKRIFGKKG